MNTASQPISRKRLTDDECERLVVQHAPLVSVIARSLLRRLPANIEIDDLIQDGMVGLLITIIQSTTVEASRRYNAYLSLRIRGAMIDGLRENDPGSRKVRHEMRRVEVAINRLSHHLGRMPQEGEVALELDIPLEKYQTLLEQAHGYTLLSLEDFDENNAEQDFLDWCASTNANPLAALERKVVQKTLLRAISELTEKEEQTLHHYYSEERTMKEIAGLLGVSEGRISQIHTQAVAKLRAAVLGDNTHPSILLPRKRLTEAYG